MKRIHRIASLVLAFFLFIGVTAPTASAADRHLKNGIGFVTASSLRLRAEASSSSETLDYAPGDDVAVVLGKADKAEDVVSVVKDYQSKCIMTFLEGDVI